MLELKVAIERNLSDTWNKSLIVPPSAYEIAGGPDRVADGEGQAELQGLQDL